MKKDSIKYIAIFVIFIGLLLVSKFTDFNIQDLFEEEKVEQVSSPDLKIYFFDVGQAESILITNNGHNMIIDGGNNVDGSLLVKYLKEELKITKIDYIISTHPHEDHIGGLDNIIKNFEIANLYMPDLTTTTKSFEDVIKAAEKKSLEVTIPENDETFTMEDLKFKVIYTGTNEEDLNASSIILRMDYKDTSYLFTADTTYDTEQLILDKDIDVDVLKVAHHGSKHASSLNFLKKATPKYAIISCGKDNDYGYPHESAMNRLKQFTDKIYVTKDLGTIILTSDGTNIEISSIKTNLDGVEKK
ncbi:MAG: MBL fold metallo-hydrolase [Bacilli bacterium]|nr:MBL fold metallo-hydrolase [Bacilli bacterium]